MVPSEPNLAILLTLRTPILAIKFNSCLFQHTRVASDTSKSSVLAQILYLEPIISGPLPAYAIGGQNILTGGIPLFRRIAAIIFIFICTSIAWMILGGTISSRTTDSSNQLSDHVLSTWGTAQEQTPPTATYTKTELSTLTYEDHGKTLTRTDKVEREIPLSLNSTRVNVDLHLDHRQKGLLWYRTYAVDFAGDYSFNNPAEEPASFVFQMPFPAQRAVYDGLIISVNGQKLPVTINEHTACAEIQIEPERQGSHACRLSLAGP